ncbi:hypothetical protein HY493_02470 [Candidatus Woesearchaeota archaeon]|nr:hypothetical protein [Candidatus Woesearchaeota archaeon]
MAVSWLTPTIWRLADPSKHARLYFQLEPLLNSRVNTRLESTKYKHILERTKEWAKKDEIVRGVQRYRTYHEELAKKLGTLKDKQVFFIPGISIDQGDANPRYLGVDYACERNFLTDAILFGIRDLAKKYRWDLHDDVHFVQVMPVMLPFHATQEGTLTHSLDDVIKATEGRIDDTFGTTTKDPTSEAWRKAIYQFSDTLIDSDSAKDAFGRRLVHLVRKFQEGEPLDEEKLGELKRLFGNEERLAQVTERVVYRVLRKDVEFNREVIAAAYASMANVLGLTSLRCFLSRSSPEMNIMQSVSKLTGVAIDDFGDGVMKNSKMAVRKEADSSAIERLMGALYRTQVQTTKTHPRLITPVPAASLAEPVYEPCETCPNNGRIKCSRAGLKALDLQNSRTPGYVSRVEHCACDIADNRFTLADVRKALMRKYDGKPLVDPERVFKELRWKRIQYRDENGQVREADERDILREDSIMQGYACTRWEDDMRLLNRMDATVALIGEKGEYQTRSLRRLLGDPKLQAWLRKEQPLGRIEPWPVTPSRPDRYSIRPSEFSSECPVARILAKIDPAKLPVDIIPHKWAIAGTKRHEIALWPLWTLDDALLKSTEVELWASVANPETEDGELPMITWFGHADALARVIGGRIIPMIFDYKRSPNEKPSYTIQEMLYLRAMERVAGQTFTGALLGLGNRSRFAEESECHRPSMHFTYADAESFDRIQFTQYDAFQNRTHRIQGLANLVVASYKQQHRIAGSRDAYLGAQKTCCSTTCSGGTNGECGHPFNSQLCTVVKRLVAGGKDVKEFLYDGVVL